MCFPAVTQWQERRVFTVRMTDYSQGTSGRRLGMSATVPYLAHHTAGGCGGDQRCVTQCS